MRCESELEPGVVCQRELGHDGPHMVEGDIPPSIARFIDAYLAELEKATKRARVARWWSYALAAIWAAGAALNFAATVNGGDTRPWEGFWFGALAGAAALALFIRFLIHLRHRKDRRDAHPDPTADA